MAHGDFVAAYRVDVGHDGAMQSHNVLRLRHCVVLQLEILTCALSGCLSSPSAARKPFRQLEQGCAGVRVCGCVAIAAGPVSAR